MFNKRNEQLELANKLNTKALETLSEVNKAIVKLTKLVEMTSLSKNEQDLGNTLKSEDATEKPEDDYKGEVLVKPTSLIGKGIPVRLTNIKTGQQVDYYSVSYAGKCNNINRHALDYSLARERIYKGWLKVEALGEDTSKNKLRTKKIVAVYPNSSKETFESAKSASKSFGISPTSMSLSIKKGYLYNKLGERVKIQVAKDDYNTTIDSSRISLELPSL